MSTIWVVSESAELRTTLAALLRPAADVHAGAPTFADFREAPIADLIVLGAVDARHATGSVMERFLAFLADVQHTRRAPQPAVYVEPSSGEPSARVARVLIDDRPLHTLAWPIDPDALLELVGEILETPRLPASLRERARRRWVTERVALLYAELDLPALRHAVDPRNAHRPVLLLGEPGTRRGLLARYVHNLAEPERERLVVLPADALHDGDIETRVLEACAGERATLYLDGLERLEFGLQQELAHFLGASGALAIETIRWVASATRAIRLAPELRLLPWIRVELPPLRERPDRADLISKLIGLWHEGTGRSVTLDAEAEEILHSYGWPGNLRELEGVIDATLSGARGESIGVDDIRLGARMDLPSQVLPPTSSTTSGPAVTREPEVSAPPQPDVAAPVEPTPQPAVTAPPRAPEPATEAVVIAEPEPDAQEAPALADILPPLANDIRRPLLAIRTYASLLDQRPEDEGVRRELTALVDEDLGRLESELEQLERYTRMGAPDPAPFDLASVVIEVLDERQERMRRAALVVLRELDHEAPPVLADAEQLRFALGILLDRALRMIPRGGDLYVGSLFHAAERDRHAHHRLLIRFHSPEEVLLGPEDGPEPALPVEVILARDLIDRAGGSFAVDTSAEDNVVLIELPA
jgi:DNA-binding NtrC family response regulator